jgi:hypothetical protein
MLRRTAPKGVTGRRIAEVPARMRLDGIRYFRREGDGGILVEVQGRAHRRACSNAPISAGVPPQASPMQTMPSRPWAFVSSPVRTQRVESPSTLDSGISLFSYSPVDA